LASFRFPGGDARTTVLGTTGSGKTTGGVWLLAHQRFDKRPWIIFDTKREALFDFVGFPPIRPLELDGPLPRKGGGLWLCSPGPAKRRPSSGCSGGSGSTRISGCS